ncbi:hypothetical protein LTR17_025172 [Elasticomyces elasticus]|nr:hypothetical protein LTR17_025172 [Elasticomyces elasticus]
MATEADYERLSNWAHMLNPDANIDRRKCQRVVKMEVLSLGVARTGTLSMQEALTILGYPNTYHYSSIFANVRDADMWNPALRAKYQGRGKPFARQEWDQLLGHCGAITDVPAICFWRELLDAYPDVKVVLVERDEDTWFKSCCTLIDGVLNPLGRYVLRFTDPYGFGRIINCGGLWIEGLFGSVDSVRAKANARASYRKHNAEIKATVPHDRLLLYRLGSGWKPLCDFLGKPIPDAAFPNRNDSRTLELAFKHLIARTVRRSLINIAVVLGGGAVAIGTVWKYLAR